MHQFTNPEHGRRSDEKNKPIRQCQRHHVEHFSAIIDNQHLSCQNCQNRKEKHFAFAHPAESGIIAFKSFGIKQIPELQEHEEREKHRQIVSAHRRSLFKIEITGKIR